MDSKSVDVADHTFALSPAQQGMWFAEVLSGDDAHTGVNIAQYVEIEGRIDVDVFREAAQAAAHETESLVVRLVEVDGQPRQFVDTSIEYEDALLDLSDAADPYGTAMEWMRRDYTAPIDLRRDVLATAKLIRLRSDHYLWYARAHHLVIDGYGAFNLLTRAAEHYNARVEGRPPSRLVAASLREIVEGEIGYRDQRRFQVDRSYWLDKVSGMPAPVRLSGRSARSSEFDRVCARELSGRLSDLIERRSAELDASPAQVIIAAYAAFLARMTSSEEVVVSLPVSGRVTARIRNAAGMLANLVPIRFTFDATTTVHQLVSESVSELVSALRHQRYRFEDLRRDAAVLDDAATSFGPIVNVLFFDSEIRLGTAVGRYHALTSGPLDDLQLNVYRAGAGASLLVELHGNANLYSQVELDSHTDRLIAFLSRLLESAPDTRVLDIELLEPAEHIQLVRDHAGRVGESPSTTLVELLAQQAAATPSAVAVTFGDATISYRELDLYSDRFARRLLARGARPETFVAVALPRGIDLIVALLGVLKSGAAYLPLDVAHPRGRLEFILYDADPVAVVTTAVLREQVPADPGRVLLFEDESGDREGRVVPITDADRAVPLHPDHVAYVIYTSGSTGRPKGVAISHRAVSTYLVNTCAEIGFSPEDVWTFCHSVAFDYSVWEIFGALVTGGRVVVVDADTSRSPDDLVRLAVRAGVTVFGQTPSAFYQFAAARRRYARAGEPEGQLSLRFVVLGGESLDPAALADWYEQSPDLPVLANIYGITETTVFVTFSGLSRASAVPGAASTIGTALPGLRTFVLNGRMSPAPIGAWGELYVAGAQLARGYVGRPALTASRFVADPFGAPGARLYRSGDIVRWNHQGALEYFGRSDQQVQLRGFRIELDEIRRTLLAYEGVSDAAVAVHRQGTDEARLIGYVVSSDAEWFATESLLRHARTLLPEYMVPSAVVLLSALPLTVNGKLDHGALPDPEIESAVEYVAPRTPTERLIATILAEILGVQRVGVFDGFFDLGGNSLAAATAGARIAEAIGTQTSIRDVFEEPTVAGLAARVDAGCSTVRPALTAAERPEHIPLAPAQNRIWLVEQADPASGAYHIPLVVQLTGDLDSAALHAAISDVLNRHEALRTYYPVVDGEAAQVILSAERVAADLDLTPRPVEPGELMDRIREFVAIGTDVRERPPIRVALLATPDPHRHVLVVVMHHLSCDGASLGPLAADVAAAYRARANGTAPDWRPPTVQYADYSIWQHRVLGDDSDPESLSAHQLRYWTDKLADAAALLELPTDRPRPARRAMHGDLVDAVVPAETYAGIAEFARDAHVTTFMVVHAALAALLARLTGSTDITIGTPIAGRSERALEPLVGMFVNTLALRTAVLPGESFADLLARTKDVDLEAFAHADVPFERVVEKLDPVRSASYAPVCQVYLAFENTHRPTLELPGLAVEVLDPGPQPAKFDMTVTVAENAAADGGVALRIDYATDLFDRRTIERIAERLIRILGAVTADPCLPLDRVDVLSENERGALVPARGDAAEPARPLAELLADGVRDPGAIALVFGDREVSYGDLDAWSNQLARVLISHGVRPGDRVALGMSRSIEFHVGLWAVAKTGAAFVPVDPRHPRERLTQIVVDGDLRVGIAVAATRELLPETTHWLELDEPDVNARIAAAPTAPIAVPVDPREAAYVLYTSGSTGQPKGVVVTHEGLANFAAEQRDRYRVDADARVLQVAAPGFDALMLEVLMAHPNAATLVVAPAQVFADTELSDLVRRHQVSHAFVTPSVLATMSPADWEQVRVLVAGGEAVPAETAAKWAPGRQLHNGYGPTETTIMVAISDALDPAGAMTIGAPIRGVETAVLDVRLQPVPVGVVGELYVSGLQLARGYLDRPAASAGVFVANPYGTPGSRMYRTGDLVRWTAGHTLEYLGRSDFQVKIRGQRIEPAEIDAILVEHPAVAAAVTVGVETDGGSRLAAYVVPSNDSVDVAELCGHAAERLPAHMLPEAVMVLDALPLSAVGKVDLAALPEPVFARTTEYVAPHDPAEQIVAEAFAAVLGVDRVGAADSFFDLGGNSLSATRATARLSSAFGVSVPVRALFDAPTVAMLAEYLRGAESAGRPPLVPQRRPDRIPLSLAQTRMWFLSQLEPNSPVYNVPVVVHLSGALDVAAMRTALADVLGRHEPLRTVYPDTEDGPHQVTLPVEAVAPELEPVDVDADELDARIAAASTTGFDVTTEAPSRFILLRNTPDEHVLVAVVHHIAIDGSSLAPLAADMRIAYEARVEMRAPEWPPLPVAYADYALWQRKLLGAEDDPGSRIAAQARYWRDTLADLPELLDLPADRPRPPHQSFRGDRVVAILPPELHRAVIDVARSNDTTVFMVMHAAFAVLLARLSGTPDIAIGTPVAGRGDPALDDLVGMFVNTLVLRVHVDPAHSFTEVLDHVRACDLAAFENSDIPFERLVELLNPPRSTAHAPLTQVGFSFQNIDMPAVEFAGLKASAELADPNAAKYDLHLNLVDTPGNDAANFGINVETSYATDLFEHATVVELLDRYVRVLRAVIVDARCVVGDIDLLAKGERAGLVERAKATASRLPDTTVVDMFASRVTKAPNATAVIDAIGGHRFTYREFADRVNATARALIERGVGPGTLVAVAMRRSIEMLSALYAVQAAGGAYLPLDPDHPAARLDIVIEAAQPVAVLVRDADTLDLPVGVPVWNLDDVDLAALDATPISDADRVRPLRPAGLAYVVYTSGSTGTPKGVAVSHGSVANQLRWKRDYYGLGPGEVILLKTPATFDLSVWELFSPLTSGATLVVTSHDAHRDPAEVAAAMAEFGVTTAHFVPSLLSAFLDVTGADDYPALRQVLCIGETLPAEIVARFRGFSDARIDNLYGPTEAAVSATVHRVDSATGAVPIGTLEPDVVGYVLDARMHPVPGGVIGELYLGGVQLARGYHARPDLTAASFVADPFGGGGRLYRTGDLVRWGADGSLRYVGRSDFQVKIRGLRIELGDIESALLEHEDVSAAVAVVHTDRDERRIVAYVVADPAPDLGQLRRFLLERLPAYMVPAAVTQIDSIPLTSSGKIDRRMLPAPRPSAFESEYVAPRGLREQAVAAIFGELLHRPAVGASDDFFVLGGNSLIATRAISRICAVFDVSIPVRAIFEASTVAELAERIEQERAVPSVPAPSRRTRPQQLPLSPAQARMWFLNQFDTDSAGYVIPIAIRLDGALDTDALVAAVGDVVDRHESLRTVYPAIDGTPTQVVVPADEVTKQYDLAPQPTDDDELPKQLADFLGAGFDVSTDVPVRAALFRLSDTAWVLALAVHHISCDGYSVAPLAVDIVTAYLARSHGAAPDWSPLTVQYADYALWQRDLLGSPDDPDSRASREIEYWRDQLAGIPQLVELPSDRPRPIERTQQGATIHLTIPEDIQHGVDSLARRAGATTFMVVHAALAVLLSRLSGSRDVAIGVPHAGRGDRSLDNLVGMFVNTLVLRARLRPHETFSALLDRLRRTDIDAFDHATVPFEQLLDALNPIRSTAHTPMFQVMLAYQNMERARLELPGLTVTSLEPRGDATIYDLLLMMTERRGPNNEPAGIELAVTYATDLFDEASIRRFAEQFRRILDAVATDPDRSVDEIELLGDAERHELLVGRNSTGEPAAIGRTLLEPFDEQVRRTPNAVALRIPDGEALTYRAFDERVNRLARLLIARGAGPDVVVGVAIRRSIELVTTLYAVLKSGAAFLPIDPDHPAERIAHVLRAARPLLVLTTSFDDADLPGGSARARVDMLDTAGMSGEPVTDADRRTPLRPDNTAYVLFTSGSTGVPKGVALTHAATASQLAWAQQNWPHDGSDVVLHKTPITFDIAVWELFWTLQTGAQVLIAEPDGHRDPAYLAEVIARYAVTTVHFVPSMLDVLLESAPSGRMATVRRVFAAGEALAQQTADRAVQVFANAELVNWYGPAEAEVVTSRVCRPDSARATVPIGTPVSGMQVYVLDARLHPVPLGVAGDLYVSGVQLARGYHGRPGHTGVTFLARPFGKPGQRMYRTGDLARWTADGELEFLGRSDFQVKVRGQRVEPGDIEAALRAMQGVASAVAVPTADRILGYVTPELGATIDGRVVRDELRRLLPSYLIPASVQVLDSMPFNANGKIDRSALPDPVFDELEEFVSPRDGREAELARIILDVVGADRVSATTDIFEIGANSLSVARIAARASVALGVEVGIRDIFEAPTIAALSARIACRTRSAATPLVRRQRPAALPLAVAQRRMWVLNQLDTASAAYNICFAVRLSGELNIAALGTAFDDVIARHETLRTIYPAHDGRPHQVVLEPAAIADLRLDPVPATDETELARWVRDTVGTGFDVATTVPIRTRLFRVEPAEHVLVVVAHHIAADGLSMAPLARDVFTAYQARVDGTRPRWQPLPLQYADYALWQREMLGDESDPTSLIARQIAYWIDQLDDAPELLELPTDRPRPATMSMAGASVHVDVPAQLHHGIAELARREGVTVFMVLHAALAILLARSANTDDVSVGTAVAGRAEQELDDLVGMFVNTLVLRTRVEEGLSVRKLLRAVRRSDLEAFAHADVPFERLVEVLDRARSTAHMPLFQVMLGLQNMPEARFELPGVGVQPLDPGLAQAKSDVIVLATERFVAAQHCGIDVEVTYATDLFNESTAISFGDSPANPSAGSAAAVVG